MHTNKMQQKSPTIVEMRLKPSLEFEPLTVQSWASSPSVLDFQPLYKPMNLTKWVGPIVLGIIKP
jgi:hypothetical protein